MAPYLKDPVDTVKYNHFHEYDDNIDELFEIREITPPPPTPEPSDPAAIAKNVTPVGKLQNVFKRMIGTRLTKRTAFPRAKSNSCEWGHGRRATLPRMNREQREANIKALRDEMFG